MKNIIIFSEETSFGTGPNGGLIAYDGYYFEDKLSLWEEWSTAMKCGEEAKYETPYDGIGSFECYERQCDNGQVIVRCLGEHKHDYPLQDYNPEAAADIMWTFMKNHPRK